MPTGRGSENAAQATACSCRSHSRLGAWQNRENWNRAEATRRVRQLMDVNAGVAKVSLQTPESLCLAVNFPGSLAEEPGLAARQALSHPFQGWQGKRQGPADELSLLILALVYPEFVRTSFAANCAGDLPSCTCRLNGERSLTASV